MLRSLVSLKQVIVNAAHYLVLGDKETYQFDPEVPFLHMVSSTPGSTRDPMVCGVPPRTLYEGVSPPFLPRPGLKTCAQQPVVPIRHRRRWEEAGLLSQAEPLMASPTHTYS